ncbi:hypothetical protein D9M73_233720 [compost metagenome]
MAQACPRQLAQMAADQAAVGVVEQGGGQGHGADLLGQLATAVKQHMGQVQPGGGEKGADRLRGFSLVDEQEGDVRVFVLRLLQNRHFPTARRAPGGPEVDDQRPASVGSQLHGLTVGLVQAHLR